MPESTDGIKPTFTERPVICQSEDGGNVTFECRCVGDPTPTVTWYAIDYEYEYEFEYEYEYEYDYEYETETEQLLRYK